MLRCTFSQHVLTLMLIIAFGSIMSACGGAAPVASHSPSPHTAAHSPTVTPLLMHSMRVDVGGYQLYVRCMGQGSPTVIFDAGLGEDVSTWDHVQLEVAQFTQACAYDRANVAPSDSRPATIKVSAQFVARELHALLVNAHLSGPYVVVGHSLGGLFVQMYACQYPREVAGLVLVDSTYPEQASRLAAALGPTFAKDAKQGFPVEGITYDEVLSMQGEVDAMKSHFPDVPLIVLMRSRFTASAAWSAAQYRQVWVSLQTDLAKRSSRGQLILAQNSSGHFIQNDRPDLVISSIHEVVLQVRHTSTISGEKKPDLSSVMSWFQKQSPYPALQ